jgi:formamidopyrimidine-DNA glycosylase
LPELIEVEAYRRAADRVVGRTVAAVDAPDAWYLKGGLWAGQLADALVGGTVGGTRRIGKLLLVDVAGRATLGLRFGMTGRLLIDGDAAVEHLEYGSSRAEPAWDRFGLRFEGGGRLVMRDPRRLGGVHLDPDESGLGVDALALDVDGLAALLGTSRAPLKARLMDQRRLAGLGNLLTDEILWRAGLSPWRAAGELSEVDLGGLVEAIVGTVGELDRRGGSHTGDLQAARHRGALCPRCGAPLRREQVGGRTTYWCPDHQH